MVSNFIKSLFKTQPDPDHLYYDQHKLDLGLSLEEFLRLKTFDHWYILNTEIIFFNRPFKISSPYWFLHSIEEIFISEVYKFETDNPQPIIIDCGANLGLSVIYFKFKHPQAIILAYEADREIFEMAKDNLKAFEFDNITLHHKAVWIANGSLEFSSEKSVGGSVTDLAINPEENDYADAPPDSWVGNYNTYYGVHKIEKEEVESVRLKDILQEHSKIDFLKIDIEGAEYKVIMDCAEELFRINKLFIEYHSAPSQPQLLNEILSVLSKSGFRYYIKEAANNYTHPYIRNKELLYDLQLNIFCFR